MVLHVCSYTSNQRKRIDATALRRGTLRFRAATTNVNPHNARPWHLIVIVRLFCSCERELGGILSIVATGLLNLDRRQFDYGHDIQGPDSANFAAGD